MNITFTLPDEKLTNRCLKEAEKEGLVTLKGHRSVGGLRASIYNAMPPEGVETLTTFLRRFESENL
jgi:phosphoserine aminotransferase